MKRLISFVIAFAILMPLQVVAQTYSVVPANTTIQFKVKNLGIMNVTGTFEKFKGTVDIDDSDITRSKADVTIEISSINTGINRRDNDLRSPNFFDAAKFPAMTFISTRVEPGGDKDTLKVIGNLTIKGVTKEVTLTVDGPKAVQGAPNKRAASAAAIVNRQDFGISSGATIGDEVYITITTELVKP